ncbi:hypothetical protein [Yersinia alsatica]|uniref:hypothetical protein n=1 Tax=Yersinia alsatica TaxID=2890317 RepID=UPI000B41C283|nr:hypothetical protein [Yersinia alsatica]OVZ84834.1 hypothetical protein CBW58_23350 [Yersinia frederiksenii]
MLSKIKKPSLLMFLGSITYYFFIFFIFILLAKCAIRFWYEGNITLTKKDITNLLVISGIVGLAAGSRTWLFAWLDERKARKSPPSDPKT